MLNRIALLLALACALASPLYSQTYTSTALQNSTGNYARVVPFAPVTVCASSDLGSPCTTKVTTYTDQTLLTQCSLSSNVIGAPASGAGCNNPGIADANGNFSVFLPAGNYRICTYAQNYQCVTFSSPSVGTAAAGAPANSIQFNCAGGFCGDSNFLWDNTNKGLTLGPTTNIGYLPLLNTPRIYVESQQNGLLGNQVSQFTVPADFRGFMNPAADSAIELFAVNGMAVIQLGSTHNFSNEQAGGHFEGDNNGSGTVANLFGLSGEAFNLGSGTVTRLVGTSGDCGTFLNTETGAIGTCDALHASIFAEGGGTITNAYGVHVVSPIFSNTSVLSNYAGLRIDDPTGGGAQNPNPLAISVAAGNSDFGGGTQTVGSVLFPRTTASANVGAFPSIYSPAASTLFFGRSGNDQIAFSLPGTANAGQINFGASGFLSWATTPGNGNLADISLFRCGVGCLGVGSGSTVQTPPLSLLFSSNSGFIKTLTGTSQTLQTEVAGSVISECDFNFGCTLESASGFGFSATNLASRDASISRPAAGILDFGGNALNSTTAKLKASAYMSLGTKFTTNNGCTDAATSGGGSAGTFTVGATTSCTEVITMGDSATAPNGWSCTALDVTTLADATNPHQTASTTTTATIVTGTIVASDKIQFSCVGY